MAKDEKNNVKTIIVTKHRKDNYHASIKGRVGAWGRGKSADEAIGDLVRTHKDILKIELVFDI